MSTFKDRLEEAVRDKGVTIAEARAELQRRGMTRANLTHWFGGRAKGATGAVLAEAADYLGVNALWLAKNEGPKRGALAGAAVEARRSRVPEKYRGHDEGELEGIISMYLEMDRDVRPYARKQWSDLLELTGQPTPGNPFGKGKKKAGKKRRPGNA